MPEGIAWENGWITTAELEEAAKAYGKSIYGRHLKKVAAGEIVNSSRGYLELRRLSYGRGDLLP